MCASGCKESQFYGLPFGQLALKKLLTSRTDYCSSVIWIPLETSLALQASSEQNSLAQKQNPLALGYQTLLSLHAGAYVEYLFESKLYWLS